MDREDLLILIREYLKDVAVVAPVADIVDFYLEARRSAGDSLLGTTRLFLSIALHE